MPRIAKCSICRDYQASNAPMTPIRQGGTDKIHMICKICFTVLSTHDRDGKSVIREIRSRKQIVCWDRSEDVED